MVEIVAPPRTVTQWQQTGYRGLRIPSCPTCQEGTWATWDELGAAPEEDIITIATRMRCSRCRETPAGLAVIACRDGA